MDIIVILLNLVNIWIQIFISTLTNINIIWITYPVYVTWIAMEIFEERKEISYGHAATNGVVAIWVSIDWLRHTILEENSINIYKIIIAGLNLIIGFIILRSAFTKSRIAKLIGKIKVVSYFQIFFSPLIYNIISFNIYSIGSIFLFFPIVYLITELFDKIIPEIIEEEEENKEIENIENFEFIDQDLYYDQYNSNYNYNNPFSSFSYNYNNYQNYQNYNWNYYNRR